MAHLDELLPEEFASPEERLALDLAREDQVLLAKLIEARRASGLSQEQVAERLGLSQATISAFERLGNDPHLSTVRRYARAVGVMIRHHVGEHAVDNGESHFLSHVSDREIEIHETAAATARKVSLYADWAWPEAGFAIESVADSAAMQA
ncbi:helix-turn-helix transcriptional regulator [Nocardioides sp. NPDC127514]|uniref:helix-turn-helix domain-containing protein n=1 Tax=unclassified Nocardioides TaxID=2615069 RepID=UPI003331C0CE